MPEPRFSVIVPAYNAAKYLSKNLEALEQQTVSADSYEVLVIDDGSTDNTAELARSFGVRVLRQENQGPAKARNQGAAAAKGEFLLFTDSDCQPTPNWIETITEQFADPEAIGTKGVYLSRQTAPMARFAQLEYEDRYDRMARFPQIDHVDTYCAAYRRDVFLDNEGFDTIFPAAAMEDQEFSFRLAQKGYKMVFTPKAKVYHLHTETLRAYFRRKYLVGYYKALVAQWLPERMLSDTHTPPVLKVQLLLLALTFALLLPALFWPQALLGPILSLGAFYLTALPFLRKIARRDAGILLPTLVYLPARALALGLGFAVGWAKFAIGVKKPRAPVLTLGQRTLKRSYDLIAATIGLILLSPFMLLVAVALYLDAAGPILLDEQRVGEHGHVFTLHRFRTTKGAEPQQQGNPPAAGTVASSRFTRVGGFLRRWRIDAWPQLVNVLKGEMSVVGPLPEDPWLVERYTTAQRQRLAMKPGLTGPVQITGRESMTLEERLALELDYISRYSLWQDARIFFKSILAVLAACRKSHFGRG